ncbi:hypothetical protein [Fimbriiglobus ruber]|uniref:Alkaline phosphatase n=1 Tax=Fimbriiglobus ruber TaxID=1908690 RepID=A0A225EE22_9BACT|nr:hypothetical protein [Fimbriiglobus ruber]OWK47539.1 Alkaline phosphatase [Fimbriiglobus ruber]
MTVIASIQPFSIAIGSGSTSATATITTVNTSNAVVFFQGFTTAYASSLAEFALARVALTNSTTVTATINSSGNACTVYGTVVEFTSAAMATSVQTGTITMSSSVTSGTATISSVTTADSSVFYLGLTTSGTSSTQADIWTTLALTNSTTVTAAKNSNGQAVTIGYAVVNFASGLINSVQPRSVTLTTANTSDTDTITSVVTANAMVVYAGCQVGANNAPSTFFYVPQLTGSTTVTLTRGGTSTTSRTMNYTVVEFASGVLNSVQRGTIALHNVTSNTATITSVSTSHAVANLNNFSSSLAAGDPAETFPGVALTNATTVTATVQATAAALPAPSGTRSSNSPTPVPPRRGLRPPSWPHRAPSWSSRPSPSRRRIVQPQGRKSGQKFRQHRFGRGVLTHGRGSQEGDRDLERGREFYAQGRATREGHRHLGCQCRIRRRGKVDQEIDRHVGLGRIIRGGRATTRKSDRHLDRQGVFSAVGRRATSGVATWVAASTASFAGRSTATAIGTWSPHAAFAVVGRSLAKTAYSVSPGAVLNAVGRPVASAIASWPRTPPWRHPVSRCESPILRSAPSALSPSTPREPTRRRSPAAPPSRPRVRPSRSPPRRGPPPHT